MENIKIWEGETGGYRLLDSGEKKKLEEAGGVRIMRSEPRAWWKKSLTEDEWKKTDAVFESENQKSWSFKNSDGKDRESVIETGISGIRAKIKFGGKSKHIGIFPEQAGQWKWIEEKISKSKFQNPNKEIKILNLFGYTGIASLVAAKAGSKVTHVDASRQSIEWARENQKLSGLEDAPIRWIEDDAVKFLKREKRRMESLPDRMGGYDAIIMDPPSYGRGPKGEVWKIEDELPKLLELCRAVLSDSPLFVIFNMYSTELSSISMANLLTDMARGLGGKIESGELAIRENSGLPQTGRLLPMSIFAIWEK